MTTDKKLKVYIIAGEPSGDLLGSRFMRAMVKKTGGQVEFYGVGGESMEKAGFKSLFDISDLAIMGLAEVIPSIPKVLRLIKQTVADIERVKPDVVITIDSWSFGSRVQKILRKKKLGIPQVHYVAPQVWAWKKKRAKTMYKYVDLLLTLLPQEPKYFTPYGLEAVFVGHPVIESKVVHGDGADFRKKFNIAADKKIIVVLPGSRKTEVSKMLPVFLEASQKLYEKDKNLCFVIPTVKTVAKMVKGLAEAAKLPVTIVEDEDDRHNAFKAAEAAMAASGTVALELAIANVPHIIGYKVSPLTAVLVRRFMHIQFVNLSNIMLGREVVSELLQEQCVPGNICRYIKQFEAKGDIYERQTDGFRKVREILGLGEQTPSENACDEVLKLIRRKG